MFKVLKIDRCAMTSFIDLLNLDTGTQDLSCFDDSAVVSDENFSFMEESKIYDCKLMLFGEFEEDPTKPGTEVTITEQGVLIGIRKCFKALINSDVYYILETDAENIVVKEKMRYDFTRIDLIQVDNVVHADFL